MKTQYKIIFFILLVWLIGLLYVTRSLYYQQPNEILSATEERLKVALESLHELKQQNDQLLQLAEDIQNLKSANDDDRAIAQSSSLRSSFNNSFLYEIRLRKTEDDVKEFWYFLTDQLNKLKEANNANSEDLNKLLNKAAEQYRSINSDLFILRHLRNDARWKEMKSRNLSKIIQRRLYHLQNPADCSKAKKLLCNLDKGCGFGCQVHHALHCLTLAYYTRRVLILKSRPWKYSGRGWESVFLPLSDKCTEVPSSHVPFASANAHSAPVVFVGIVDGMPRHPAFAQAVPTDLSKEIESFHGHPYIWWAGQLMSFLMRPNSDLSTYLNDKLTSFKFKTPIVGIHVRRTDKLHAEAAFHDISEYMKYADEWFNQYEANLLTKRVFKFDQKGYFHSLEVSPTNQSSQNGAKNSHNTNHNDNNNNNLNFVPHKLKRRIYLATDDPKLLEEAVRRYPDHEFLSDEAISRSASLSNRYTESSLYGLLVDIYLLSYTDFLVCTFSSQVCRVSYELMQSMHGDASTYYQSLDDLWYAGGQHGHSQVAILPHVKDSSDEFDFKIGDVIGIAGNHWNGRSKGENRRTFVSGMYPSYKTRELFISANFSSYSDIDKMGGFSEVEKLKILDPWKSSPRRIPGMIPHEEIIFPEENHNIRRNESPSMEKI